MLVESKKVPPLCSFLVIEALDEKMFVARSAELSGWPNWFIICCCGTLCLFFERPAPKTVSNAALEVIVDCAAICGCMEAI